MYFDRSTQPQNASLEEALDVRILLSANSPGLIFPGFSPSIPMTYCIFAFR